MNNTNPEEIRQGAIQKCLQHNYEGAFFDYKKLIFEHDFISPAILSEAGYVCWQLGLYDEAIESFNRALELDPNHRESLINLVELKLTINDLDGLDPLLTNLLDNYSNDPEAIILKAKKLLLEGKSSEGISLIKHITETFKSSRIAQLLSCRLLLETNHFDEAADISKYNIDAGDDHPDFYLYYAKALTNQDDQSAAESVYEKMIDLFPKRVAPYLGLAEINLTKQQYLLAKNYLNHVLQLVPEQITAVQMLLNILVIEEKWNDILEITTPFIDKDIQLEWLLVYHLSALGNLKKDEEIRKFFKQYPHLVPGKLMDGNQGSQRIN